MALDGRTGDALADASALFNLLRNLGGAIAIALIDTILSQRTPGHAAALAERLRQGDADAAALVGLPAELVQNAAPGPIDEATRAYIAPLVERAALVQSFNEAWLLLGAAFCASILALALLSRSDARPGGR
jgi:DHA2 family multidrug resistance protein